MISYNPKEWFSIIFFLRKSDTVRTLMPAMLSLALLVAGFCYVEIEVLNFAYTSTIAMHSLVGFVISMLLVFRTNTAYERWWEGRKQWGALVNVSRNFAIRIAEVVPADDRETRQHFRVLVTDYVFALKEHLRSGVKRSEMETHARLDLDGAMGKGHVPNAIAQQLFSAIMQLRTDGRITEQQLISFDALFNEFTDITGACERIRKTPIPYSYSAFIKKFIFIYVISLPFGIVTEFNYATIGVTVFVFYILASLELIAEEIEDPFGTDTNDLPTDDIAKTIQANLKEILA
jgi:ion channel-forming bestrophin family protein